MLKRNDEKKKWLGRYVFYKREMYHVMDELREINEMIDNIQAQKLTGMPSGSGKRQSVQEATIEKIMVIQERWIKRVDAMHDVLDEIDHAISTIDDSTLRDLLRYRYIDGMKWEEIAFRMGYSWRNIHNLHARALDCIELHTV